MEEGELQISISTCSDKLRQNFPEDPKSDIQIEFKNKVFRLSKAHLRLESGYFRKILTAERAILHINQDFNETFFSNVLECLYGASLKIKRQEMLSYFPIVQFLEIDTLIQQLRTDMVEHTSEYSFFPLFDLAYRYSDQCIFEKCLLELEYHDFSQIKQQKEQMFAISLELFKLIVKSHNRLQKEKQPFNAYQINTLITQYCQYNKLSATQKNNVKFDIIDKNKLSSDEYRDIFLMDDNSHKNNEAHGRKIQTRALSLNPTKGETHISTNSLSSTINISLMTHKKLYLEMDTTFERKISAQLMQQKTKLFDEIKTLNTDTINQHQKSKNTKKQFEILKKKLSQNSNEQSISDKIKSIDSNLSEFEKSMSTQSQRLKTLMDSTKELMEKYDKDIDHLSASQSSCHSSSLWNIHEKTQRVSDFVLIKNDNKSNANKSNTSFISKSESQIKDKTQNNISISTLKEKDKQNSKLTIFQKQTRLEFDKDPIIIKTPKQLQNLANLITTQRFVKKKLVLLYRGEKPQKKGNNSKASLETAKKMRQQLKDQQNVLFLIRTEMDKLIGAFSSIPLKFSKEGDYTDQHAFIFTLTQHKKFPIKPQQTQQAIMINKGYIICFGTDLMLSENIFEVENYCGWPSSYCGNPDRKDWRDDWFVEDSQFGVKEVECYGVEDAGTDMII